MTRLPAALAALLGAAGLLVARSWTIDIPYSIDFRVYHLAGERLASGRAADLYAPQQAASEGQQVALARNEFKNLPIIAAAFIPFSWLPYLAAKRVFWILSLACLLGAAFVTARCAGRLGGRADPAWFCLVTALFLAAAPAHISLRHGQLTPVALLGLAISLSLALSGRDRAAGAVLACAAALKIPLLALVASDVARRATRRLLWWAVASAALLASSILLFGPALHGSYLDHIFSHAGRAMTGHNNQSLDGALMRIMTRDSTLNDWTPLAEPVPVMAVRSAASVALLGVLAFALWRSRSLRGPRALALDLPAFLSLGLLLFPVAWDHYFLFLILALPYLVCALPAPAGTGERLLRLGSLVAAGALLMLPTPHGLLEGSHPPGLAAHIAISHYTLGALVMFLLSALGLSRCGKESPAR